MVDFLTLIILFLGDVLQYSFVRLYIILTVYIAPFQLKPGAEGNGVGEAKRNFSGDGKFELPVKEGETLVIISEKGCPQGKWLIKNPEGHCKFA